MFRIATVLTVLLLTSLDLFAQEKSEGSIPTHKKTYEPPIVAEVMAEHPEYRAAYDLAKQIAGQPPQLSLGFVREHPYTRSAIQDAAKFVGMNPNLLAGMLFAEMWPPPDYMFDGYQDQMNSYAGIPVDSFGHSYERLKANGLLPEDFEAIDAGFEIENEGGMPVKMMYFKNLRDGIFGFAALAKEREWAGTAALAHHGIHNPTLAEIAMATALYYNVGYPHDFFHHVIAETQARGLPLAQAGSLAPSWHVGGADLFLGAQNAGRVVANTILFAETGVAGAEVDPMEVSYKYHLANYLPLPNDSEFKKWLITYAFDQYKEETKNHRSIWSIGHRMSAFIDMMRTIAQTHSGSGNDSSAGVATVVDGMTNYGVGGFPEHQE